MSLKHTLKINRDTMMESYIQDVYFSRWLYCPRKELHISLTCLDCKKQWNELVMQPIERPIKYAPNIVYNSSWLSDFRLNLTGNSFGLLITILFDSLTNFPELTVSISKFAPTIVIFSKPTGKS